jgi:hypothetical protein
VRGGKRDDARAACKSCVVDDLARHEGAGRGEREETTGPDGRA